VSWAAGADLPLDELLARQQALVAQLRDVEHWRRLAAARLDLAVAAVTDIDELASRPLPGAGAAPGRLRTRVGIPAPRDALPETTVLFRLRSVLDELEIYAATLRHACDQVSREVLRRLDAEGHLQAYCRQVRQERGDHPGPRRAVTHRSRSPRGQGQPTVVISPAAGPDAGVGEHGRL